MTNNYENNTTQTIYSGQIIKALSGFYYVEDSETGKIMQTRGRGQFRNTKTTPLVGDYVKYIAENDKEGLVVEIVGRRNELIRPAIANVDLAFLVASVTEPTIQPKLLDRFLVYLESMSIETIIYFSKYDLLTEEEKEASQTYNMLYEDIGYHVFNSSDIMSKIDELKQLTTDQTMVVVGQSGVGKSTFLNNVLPELAIETGEISMALGRGRHTTRYIELHHVLGGKVADSPGFSSIDLDHIDKIELSSYFPEIRELAYNCKFRECTHIHEPKCAVREGLANGEVSQSRYDSYLQMFEEIDNIKPTYKRKK